jgi:adenosylcobinamide-GDP ribazoletransferase
MMLNGLREALRFLTRVPVGQGGSAAPLDLAGARVWFPFVGGLIGFTVALALGTGIFWGPWFGALAALFVWVAVTGGLHLDGLGDVADGFGAAHRTPDRILEVMQDSRAGNFAVIAIALQLVCKLVLLSKIDPTASVLAVVLVPAWARWGSLALADRVDTLGSGLGARFGTGVDRRVVVIWGVCLTALSIFVSPALIAALILAPLGVLYWRRSLGGITGDGHGASIEVMETVLLVLVVVSGG